MKEQWDSRYQSDNYVYGTEPNDFFRIQLNKRKSAGKILLPADGEGRNAVYAASLGWEVYAFDFSAEAKKKALLLAEKSGVKLSYDTASLEDFHFPDNFFDAVGLFFFHLPDGPRQYLHHASMKSLKQGGHIFLEAFEERQITLNSGGPKNKAFLFEKNMLLNDFKGMEAVHAELVTRKLNEGPLHQGDARLIQLVLRKT